ncbi:hypothetical protein NA56DRAFT_340636 [Hyaloscypha hepaticicola]|uniref:Uncharacterized protein n=1 Tax=Hyaloscypha hepaticicola TaxID=2082293 RepID=A0A2J6QJ24_9HELO|nr:hypothetical protein NA56DRAFT_340636 [Hyaloscypha hepaticicola]
MSWHLLITSSSSGYQNFKSSTPHHINTSSTEMKITASVIKESYLVNSLIHLHLISPHLHASESSPYYCSNHRSIERSPAFLCANEQTYSTSYPRRPSQVESSPVRHKRHDQSHPSHPSIHPLCRSNLSLCTLNPLSPSAFIYA